MRQISGRLVALGALTALALAGCTREFQTQDGVTPTVGNAVRANATIHAVRGPDALVNDTSLRSDGAVTARTLDRYRTGTTSQGTAAQGTAAGVTPPPQ